MFDTERTDAYASAELGNSGLKVRLIAFAKIGFWVVAGFLAIRLFMDAVYFTHL